MKIYLTDDEDVSPSTEILKLRCDLILQLNENPKEFRDYFKKYGFEVVYL